MQYLEHKNKRFKFEYSKTRVRVIGTLYIKNTNEDEHYIKNTNNDELYQVQRHYVTCYGAW